MTANKTERMPTAYRAFEALFTKMDTPILRVIGGILRAMPSRMDTAGAFENQPMGDFIGYDGLESRGALANLLETEWLLRELDPDDFVRRISEGEVLFRKRNFQDAGKRNTLAVILDCGPWMLGRNRLMGLAALFHLAIRAERMRADLHWIVPGSQDRGWRQGLTQKTVQRYLGQIVQTPLDDAKIDEVLSRLDVIGELDCWYVGSQHTAHVAQHPGIGGAMILHTRYGEAATHTAEIEITHRNRRLAKTAISFVDDDTCIAALRRPFKPEVIHKPNAPGREISEGGLTDQPFQTRWQFDRHNKAVQVHMAEGVLWQPLMPTQRDQGVWIPIASDCVLMGLTVDRDNQLHALIAKPPSRLEKQNPQMSEITRYSVDLNGPSSTALARAKGVVTINPAMFSGHPVGNFHISPQLSVVRNDGVRNTFPAGDKRRLYGPRRSDKRVIYTDQTYRVQITDAGEPHVEVFSNSRQTIMLRARLLNPARHLTQQPRRILYSPSQKVLSISFDGTTYEVYGFDDTFTQAIPDGLTLLDLDHLSRGLAWNAEHRELIRLSFGHGEARQKTITQYHGPATQLPRFCTQTGLTLALQTDTEGQPEYIVRIHAKKGWKQIKPLNINTAIENARTIWLNS